MTEIAPIAWWPVVTVLVAGVVIGAIVSMRSRRFEDEGEDTIGRIRELSARRDTLIELLREEVDGGTVEERRRLELELASTLQSIDAAGPLPQTTRTTTDRRSSQIAGFLWGFGSMAVIAAIIIGVMASARDRGAGDEMTGGFGSDPAGAVQRPPTTSPEIETVRRRVAEDPEDLDLRIELAERLLAARDLVAVHEQTQYVLERDPTNPLALSYEAIVRLAMGQTGPAIEMLETAVQSDPSLLEPKIHLSIAYFQTGQRDRASELLTDAIDQHPEHEAMLKRLRDELESAPSRAAR